MWKAPVRFVAASFNGQRKYPDQQFVVLNMILAHPINVGYDPASLCHLQVAHGAGGRCSVGRVLTMLLWLRAGGACKRRGAAQHGPPGAPCGHESCKVSAH